MTQKSSSLHDPLHRYLHRCLVFAIRVRKDSTVGVTTKDLVHLFCIIDEVPCNLAHSRQNFSHKREKRSMVIIFLEALTSPL
ncbi:hypothetical protein HanPI659440_Chr13g0482581 [Helianthus annuus]|nr:hypothetical protein HanPI659440_Chr13g0482581 [Helianthus annuus]